jgi:hypothetical protein
VPAPDFFTTTALANFQSGDPAAIVAQVQQSIRDYCGWHVAGSFEETLTLDGPSSRRLWLPSLYVTEVTLVTNEGVELDPSEYDWSAGGWIELRSYGWWTDRPRQIEVTLTHGYTTAPATLAGVAASVAARAIASPSGATREQVGSVALGYGTFNGVSGGIALLEHEKEQLDQYRLPPRP